jgi:hypothetical protein
MDSSPRSLYSLTVAEVAMLFQKLGMPEKLAAVIFAWKIDGPCLEAAERDWLFCGLCGYLSEDEKLRLTSVLNRYRAVGEVPASMFMGGSSACDANSYDDVADDDEKKKQRRKYDTLATKCSPCRIRKVLKVCLVHFLLINSFFRWF